MALGPAPPALISARQWLSVLRSGGSKKTRFAAIMLAESVESVIHPEHILELSGSEEDTAKPEYIMTKLSLSELVKTTNPIRLSTLCPNETAK